MDKLITAQPIERTYKLGLGENIWYLIDYIDEQGKERTTIQYVKDIEKACQKKGIDWLSEARQ